MIKLDPFEIALLTKLEKSQKQTLNEILLDIGCNPETFFDELNSEEISDPFFYIGQRVFYPYHGEGQLLEIEKVEIDGETISVIVLSITKNNGTESSKDGIVKIPVEKAKDYGLRPLYDDESVNQIFRILVGYKSTWYNDGNWIERVQKRAKSNNLREIAKAVALLHSEGAAYPRNTLVSKLFNDAIYKLVIRISRIERRSKHQIRGDIMQALDTRIGYDDSFSSVVFK